METSWIIKCSGEETPYLEENSENQTRVNSVHQLSSTYLKIT